MMVNCKKCAECRKCRLQVFSLQHTRPDLFVSAQFGGRWTITTWYSVWTVYLVSNLLLDLCYYRRPLSPRWLLSPSNWAFLLVTCSAAVNCLVVIYVHAYRPDTANGCMDRLPWYMRLQWVLTTTSSTSALLVALLYWALDSRELTHSSINTHILAVAYVLVKSLFISSKPVRIFHFVQPVILGIAYLIVSLVHQLTTTDGAIYYLLYWRVPQRSVPFSGCVVLLVIPMVHCIFFAIHKLRIFIFKRFFDESHSTSSTCSLQRALHGGVTTSSSSERELNRRVTATNIILLEEPAAVEVEVRTECKDDLELRRNSNNVKELFSRLNSRLYSSENDLREYTMKNGFYCEFARSSHILHHTRCGLLGSNSDTAHGSDRNRQGGSQLIVVQTCGRDTGSPRSAATESLTDESSDCVSSLTTDDGVAYL